MKYIYRIGADSIWLIHGLIVLIAFFGWLVPSLWTIYMSILILTLLSDLIYGYCLLSKWEFSLRKSIDPTVNYNYTWSSFYTYKLTQKMLSNKFVQRVALFFIFSSLLVNFYFHFFYKL